MSQSSKLARGIAALNNGKYKRAFSLLRPLAEDGLADAQCAIASMYHLGLGVDIDGELAVSWYLKAANQGYALAYNNLACIYETGVPGVKPDRSKAKECYRQAIEKGFKIGPPRFKADEN